MGLGSDPSDSRIENFVDKAYDHDYTAASSIDSAAVAMHKIFGFGPVNAQWEAYAQGKKGATMVLKVADGADFDTLADNLRTAGYQQPKDDDGVWDGGTDLVAGLDPSLSPEVQYVALLEDQGLVVTSDQRGYAAEAASVAAGDGSSAASKDGVTDLADPLGEPANALVWTGDFACDDLAMSQADQDDQAQAKRLVSQGGRRDPALGPGDGDAARPDPARGRTLRGLGAGEEEPPLPCEARRRRRPGREGSRSPTTTS